MSRAAALAGVAAVLAAGGGAVGGYLVATPPADAEPAAGAPVEAHQSPAPFGPVLPSDHSLAAPTPTPAPVHTVTVTRVVRAPASPPAERAHRHGHHGGDRPGGHDHRDRGHDGHRDGGRRS